MDKKKEWKCHLFSNFFPPQECVKEEELSAWIHVLPCSYQNAAPQAKEKKKEAEKEWETGGEYEP